MLHFHYARYIFNFFFFNLDMFSWDLPANFLSLCVCDFGPPPFPPSFPFQFVFVLSTSLLCLILSSLPSLYFFPLYYFLRLSTPIFPTQYFHFMLLSSNLSPNFSLVCSCLPVFSVLRGCPMLASLCLPLFHSLLRFSHLILMFSLSGSNSSQLKSSSAFTSTDFLGESHKKCLGHISCRYWKNKIRN